MANQNQQNQNQNKDRDERQQQQSGGAGTQHRGGSGNFAEDRERASEAGRKGGQHSHDNDRKS